MLIGRNRWTLIVQRGRQFFRGKPENYIVDPSDRTAVVLDDGSPARLASATAHAVAAMHRAEGFVANGPVDNNVMLLSDDYDDLPKYPLLPDEDEPDSQQDR